MSPRFTGPYARDLREFIAFKRTRGCLYGPRVEHRLLSFDRFVAANSSGRRPALKRLIGKWLSRSGQRDRKTVMADLSTIRQFCLFLRRRVPNCHIPDLGDGPTWKQVRKFRPYIFSVDEVLRLLHHAGTLRPRFRARTFQTMIAVYYCTGIRPGEGTRLRLCDLDLKERTLLVRKSKKKTRWVPFHADLRIETLGPEIITETDMGITDLPCVCFEERTCPDALRNFQLKDCIRIFYNLQGQQALEGRPTKGVHIDLETVIVKLFRLLSSIFQHSFLCDALQKVDRFFLSPFLLKR